MPRADEDVRLVVALLSSALRGLDRSLVVFAEPLVPPQPGDFFPMDWPQVARRVRLVAAKGRCQACPSRPHGEIVRRCRGNRRWWDQAQQAWRDGRGRKLPAPAPAEDATPVRTSPGGAGSGASRPRPGPLRSQSPQYPALCQRWQLLHDRRAPEPDPADAAAPASPGRPVLGALRTLGVAPGGFGLRVPLRCSWWRKVARAWLSSRRVRRHRLRKGGSTMLAWRELSQRRPQAMQALRMTAASLAAFGLALRLRPAARVLGRHHGPDRDPGQRRRLAQGGLRPLRRIGVRRRLRGRGGVSPSPRRLDGCARHPGGGGGPRSRSWRPSSAGFRVAPITAIIVLLGTAGATLGPVGFAVDRVLEVGLGCAVGLLASVLIVRPEPPARCSTSPPASRGCSPGSSRPWPSPTGPTHGSRPPRRGHPQGPGRARGPHGEASAGAAQPPGARAGPRPFAPHPPAAAPRRGHVAANRRRAWHETARDTLSGRGGMQPAPVGHLEHLTGPWPGACAGRRWPTVGRYGPPSTGYGGRA